MHRIHRSSHHFYRAQPEIKKVKNQLGFTQQSDLSSELNKSPGYQVREKNERKSGNEGDRRKVCRRILRKNVLIECRSGLTRRIRRTRANDMLDNIYVKT